jgi:hypothetical protein
LHEAAITTKSCAKAVQTLVSLDTMTSAVFTAPRPLKYALEATMHETKPLKTLNNELAASNKAMDE